MTRSFSAYAPPLTYGSKMEVASHLGSVTYKINYAAVGSINVMGRVHYYRTADGGKVTEVLPNGGTITTADVAANVEVDFQGAGTGSAVNGIINP